MEYKLDEQKIKEKLVQILNNKYEFNDFLNLAWKEQNLTIRILTMSEMKESYEFDVKYVDGLIEIYGAIFDIITSYKMYFFLNVKKAVLQTEKPRVTFSVNLEKILNYGE